MITPSGTNFHFYNNCIISSQQLIKPIQFQPQNKLRAREPFQTWSSTYWNSKSILAIVCLNCIFNIINKILHNNNGTPGQF